MSNILHKFDYIINIPKSVNNWMTMMKSGLKLAINWMTMSEFGLESEGPI